MVKKNGKTEGFVPRAARRQLEQQRSQLSFRQSQQQQSRQPQQQHRVPFGFFPLA